MISIFYEKIVGASPPPEVDEPKILCVGLACIDTVQVCHQFPVEDLDNRCIECRWRRGGNASNNCTVLSLLGKSCEFLGILSTKQHLDFLQNDMRKYKIDFSHCKTVEGVDCPTSTIILSLATGTRTIIHYNLGVPELTLEDFEKLNLEDYSWIHFEGRNTAEVLSMMQYVESYNNSLIANENEVQTAASPVRSPITISLELERQESELLDLLPYADVAFISKEFAQGMGFDNMNEALKNIAQDAKSGATLICAWGDRGAMARTRDGITVQSPAYPPHTIIDTLGAGDTFIGAVLYYLDKTKLMSLKHGKESKKHLNKGNGSKDDLHYETTNVKREISQNHNIESLECSQSEFINRDVLQAAVTFGCRVAGAKVGLRGFDGLARVVKDI